jgi:hypothetical protein
MISLEQLACIERAATMLHACRCGPLSRPGDVRDTADALQRFVAYQRNIVTLRSAKIAARAAQKRIYR